MVHIVKLTDSFHTHELSRLRHAQMAMKTYTWSVKNNIRLSNNPPTHAPIVWCCFHGDSCKQKGSLLTYMEWPELLPWWIHSSLAVLMCPHLCDVRTQKGQKASFSFLCSTATPIFPSFFVTSHVLGTAILNVWSNSCLIESSHVFVQRIVMLKTSLNCTSHHFLKKWVHLEDDEGFATLLCVSNVFYVIRQFTFCGEQFHHVIVNILLYS